MKQNQEDGDNSHGFGELIQRVLHSTNQAFYTDSKENGGRLPRNHTGTSFRFEA